MGGTRQCRPRVGRSAVGKPARVAGAEAGSYPDGALRRRPYAHRGPHTTSQSQSMTSCHATTCPLSAQSDCIVLTASPARSAVPRQRSWPRRGGGARSVATAGSGRHRFLQAPSSTGGRSATGRRRHPVCRRAFRRRPGTPNPSALGHKPSYRTREFLQGRRGTSPTPYTELGAQRCTINGSTAPRCRPRACRARTGWGHATRSAS